MGDKVGENPAALRAAVFLLSAKNRRGGVQTPPPAGRRLIQSVRSTNDAMAMTAQVQDILAKGNFTIKHWTISGQAELHGSNITLSNAECDKILGMLRKPASDYFLFDAKLNLSKNENKVSITSRISKEELVRVLPPTLARRTLLRQTTTIFDHLGLIIPFTNILVRNLTTRHLPNKQEECKSERITFITDMLYLENVGFYRCLRPPDTIGELFLIMFTDASSQAYGDCAYVQWQLQSGQCKTCLILVKNEISPNRQLSKPRLELCGAVLGYGTQDFLPDAASNELRDMTTKWNRAQLADAGRSHGVTRKSTKSADAPRENDCCESLIRLIKGALTLDIGDGVLIFSELQTVPFEITNPLNERRTGRKPGADPLNGSYVSPNDLLLGRTCINPVCGGVYQVIDRCQNLSESRNPIMHVITFENYI